MSSICFHEKVKDCQLVFFVYLETMLVSFKVWVQRNAVWDFLSGWYLSDSFLPEHQLYFIEPPLAGFFFFIHGVLLEACQNNKSWRYYTSSTSWSFWLHLKGFLWGRTYSLLWNWVAWLKCFSWKIATCYCLREFKLIKKTCCSQGRCKWILRKIWLL